MSRTDRTLTHLCTVIPEIVVHCSTEIVYLENRKWSYSDSVKFATMT